eukprot:TRINITY_DN11265_c0_g1_i1.p1 TRINITY_DN11265_c0_g1~~TRINITY_DN11265_c0_g1_i1.p1  ORF type:complete len:325 (+),score=44.57 TRINITY_DN11265_c0_g1_i1:171-1145(+)
MERLDMRQGGDLCGLCLCKPLLEEYEAFISGDVWSIKTSNDGAAGDNFNYIGSNKEREQRRHDSHLIKVLKTLAAMCRAHNYEAPNIEVITDKLQKEFLELRQLWIALWDRISILDEMDMARKRLELAPEGLTDLDILSHYITHPEQERTEQLSREQVAAALVDQHRGQLRFLREQASANENACPICHHEPDQWAVLECGHRICLECLQQLRKKGNTLWIKCPYRCAIKTSSAKVNYTRSGVQTDNDNDNDDADDDSVMQTLCKTMFCHLNSSQLGNRIETVHSLSFFECCGPRPSAGISASIQGQYKYEDEGCCTTGAAAAAE